MTAHHRIRISSVLCLALAGLLVSVAGPGCSKPPSSSSGAGEPGAPVNVFAVAGDGSVTVTWKAPASTGTSAISAYTVVADPGGQVATSTGATTATVTGLTNGTSYVFSVSATNAAGTGPTTLSNIVTPAPAHPVALPGAPVGVVAVAGDQQATITWSPPIETAGGAAASYSVTETPGGKTTSVSGTTATVTGLVDGTAYVFAVAATNAAGTGPAVSSNPVTPVAVAGTPGAPTDVTVAAVGDGWATVTWAPPATDGGSPIQSYTVTPSTGAPLTAAGSSTSATFTGLTDGTAYTFSVVATNAIGNGPAGVTASATPVGLPGEPLGVTAGAGDRQATVSWSAPLNTGGGSLGTYAVTVTPGDVTTSVSGTTTVITGLTDGTMYVFSVAATNAAGTGLSAVSNAVTPEPLPGVPGAPASVSVATVGDGWATVTWTTPASSGGSPIESYTVAPLGGTPTIVPAAATSATISNLTDGTAYTFSVFATNAAGDGPKAVSAAATPAALPGAPLGVTAVAGDGQATVTWNAPVETGGGTLGNYSVTVTPGGATTSVSGTTTLITGLTDGTIYVFAVAATDATGTGPFASSNAVTPVPTPGAPTAPTNVLVSSIGNGWATVVWTAPASNGGSAIQSYTVTPSGGPPVTGPGSVASATVSGLSDGTAYTFSVFATNAAGSGPAGMSSAATPLGLPGAPTGVIAVAGASQAAITWSAPVNTGGGTLGSYVVTVTPGAAQQTVSGTTTVVTGLVDGTAYVFSVAATNAAGAGPSASSTAVTPQAAAVVPSAPSAVLVPSVGSGSATVTWTAPVSTGGSVITSYTITPSGGSPTTVPAAATSATLAGLTNGMAYSFSVYATNAVGNGPSAVSGPVTPVGLPGAPTGVLAIGTQGQAQVTWSPPGNTGGGTLGNYVVTLTPGGTSTSVAGTSTVITGLAGGTAYVVSVAATNAAGIGPSASSSVVRIEPSATRSTFTATPAGASTEDPVMLRLDLKAAAGTPLSGLPVTLSTSGADVTLSRITGSTDATGTFLASMSSPVAQTVGVTATTTGLTLTLTVPYRSAVACAAGAVFSHSTPSAVGQDPLFVALGDVNGDGAADVVTANANSDTVSVLLGLGDGTFRPPLSNVTGSTPIGVVLGDFNGDGRVDIAVANQDDNTISIMLGNGDGTFQPQSTDPVGVGPYGLAIGDFNGDGKLDLVTTDTGQTIGTGSTVTILLGNGDGTFQSGLSDTVGDGPIGVAVSDFNGDGKLDIVTANGTGSTSVLIGNGDGTFQPALSTPFSGVEFGVAVADFNGDGRPDLTVTDYEDGIVNVLLGKGDGTFQAALSNPIGFSAVLSVVGDFNGDGHLDIVASDLSDGWVSVLAGNGDGTFQGPLDLVVPGLPAGVVAGDFNGDGRLDIAASDVENDGLDVLLNTCAASAADLPGAPTSVVAIAGNGQATVGWSPPTKASVTGYTVTVTPGGTTTVVNGTSTVVTGLTNGTSYVISIAATSSGGSGPAAASNVVTPSAAPGAPTNIDVSAVGSGWVTLTWTAAASNGSPILGYTITASGGASTTQTTVPADPTSATITGLTNGTPFSFSIAALNAAGAGASSSMVSGTPKGLPGAPVNVVAAAGSSSVTATWSAPGSTGGSAITSYTATIEPGGTSMTAAGTLAMFTGLIPGVTYLVSVAATNAVGSGPAATSNTVAIVPAGALSTFTATPPSSYIHAPVTLNLSLQDAAGAALGGWPVTLTATGTDVILKPASGTTSVAGTFVAIVSSAHAQTVEITATTTGLTQTLSVVLAPELVCHASTSFTAAASPDPGFILEGIALADFNADGKLDIVTADTGANGGNNTLSVMLGNGDGTFQSPLSHYSGTGPVGVATGDLNNDGRADLVVANYGDDGAGNTIGVLLGEGGGAFANQTTTTVGAGPYGIAVGDFNNDGYLDVVATLAGALNGTQVTVLLGKGDGTFQTPLTDTVGTGPLAVAVGDFNNDGKPDIVAANSSGTTVSVLLGKGDGTFQAQLTATVGTGPEGVAVGDFNGDGDLDIVTANFGGNNVSVLLGKGDGTFQAQLTAPASNGPIGVAVADFNGDGRLDIAATNASTTTATVLLGKGDGTFPNSLTETVGAGTLAVATGDVNGDGRTDFVTASNSTKTVSVLLNTCE